MLTLYYSPYACSMASHVALEEAGLTFEAVKVSIPHGEQFTPEYKVVNPRSKVPALRFDDGRVLLESTAIFGWIHQTAPYASLLGDDDALDQARTMATCAWLSGTVHPTFAQFIHPERATQDKDGHAAVQAYARESYWSYLQEMNNLLADRPWIMGDRFTVADAYALVFFPWGRDLKLPIGELTHLAAMKDRMIERPAARRALEREKSVLLRM